MKKKKFKVKKKNNKEAKKWKEAWTTGKASSVSSSLKKEAEGRKQNFVI